MGWGVGLLLQVMVHDTICNAVFLMEWHCIQYIIMFKWYHCIDYGVESALNSQKILFLSSASTSTIPTQ